MASPSHLRWAGAACAAAVLCTPALSGQDSLSLFETINLPSMGGSTCDHATVAVNDRGDIFAAWSSALSVSGVGTRRVEGIYIPRKSAINWGRPDPANLFLLADPALALVDGSPDRCFKPDVVGVGDNFVVAWPRISTATEDAWLEVARIVIDPLGNPSVDSPGPGQGYAVDPRVFGGKAGLMPDLVRITINGFEKDVAGVVYAHENYSDGAGAYGYELRSVMADFRQAAPVFGTPEVLVSDIRVDDSVIGTTGGRVLPDVVADDHRHLVLAWEDYREAGSGSARQARGQIHVRRFEMDIGGGFQELESLTFWGANPGTLQRRPNLAASRYDSSNTVSLAWMEVFDPAGEADSYYLELDFLGGEFPGPVDVRDLSFPNTADASDTRPLPVHGENNRICLADYVQNGAESVIRGYQAEPTVGTITLDLGVRGPRRAATNLWEVGGVGPGANILPLVFEAHPNPTTSKYRIFLMIAGG